MWIYPSAAATIPVTLSLTADACSHNISTSSSITQYYLDFRYQAAVLLSTAYHTVDDLQQPWGAGESMTAMQYESG